MKTKISLLLTIIWFMLPSFASAEGTPGLSFGFVGSGMSQRDHAWREKPDLTS